MIQSITPLIDPSGPSEDDSGKGKINKSVSHDGSYVYEPSNADSSSYNFK